MSLRLDASRSRERCTTYTAAEGAWDRQPPAFGFAAERFLEGQFTEPELRERYISLDPAKATELCSLPTLFAYEHEVGSPARVGRVTQISRGARSVEFTFELDSRARPISHNELQQMQASLGIADSFELQRSHWAVKAIDLLDVLGSFHPHASDIKLRPDANRIALAAARQILSSVEAFESSIHGRNIRVEPGLLPPEAWPRRI